VLAVERRGSFPIADGERDVIEGHQPMIAFTRQREGGDPVPTPAAGLSRERVPQR
jgi:hypothetical protein